MNAVKNSMAFLKLSKSLFFEKIVIKYPKINHTKIGVCQLVRYLKHV